MGKTFRYNPDDEDQERAWSGTREKRKCGKIRKTKQTEERPETVDLSWVVERMQAHISYVVESLVNKQLIDDGDREEYKSLFTAEVCRAWERYDPNRVGAKSGKTASPLHFMTMCVDSKLSNVMKYLAYRRWKLKFYSLTDDEDEADNDDNLFWNGNVSLSDGRRAMKDLVFRLDAETLFVMLTDEERMTLVMRYKGYTAIEIAEALSLAFHRKTDRHRVQKIHIPRIQKKAKLCGFVPANEVFDEKF